MATTPGLRAPEVLRAQVAVAEMWAPVLLVPRPWASALQEAPKQVPQLPVAAWCSDEAGATPAGW